MRRLRRGSVRGDPEGAILVNAPPRRAEGAASPGRTWTHVRGPYDGPTRRAFVSDVLVATSQISGSDPASSGVLRIGDASLWGECVRDRIDEIRLHGGAVSRPRPSPT